MTSDEKILLNNVLDGLDKLFDREYDVWDIYALIFATSKALEKTQYSIQLNKATHNLKTIIDTNKKDTLLALTATDELRHFLADMLD